MRRKLNTLFHQVMTYLVSLYFSYLGVDKRIICRMDLKERDVNMRDWIN